MDCISYRGDGARLAISEYKPVSEAAPYYLVFEPAKGQCGFADKAYDGVYLRENISCHVSAYLRSDNYSGSVRIKIGNQICILADEVTSRWTRHEAVFTASAMERHELFVVELEEDRVAVCGVFRRRGLI